MFCIKIADVVIGIDNRYPEIREQCRDYIVEDEAPAFTVSASADELRQQAGQEDASPAYCESLCIYRKLSLRMIDYDAFLMHSAVIEVDGNAYAFTAPSGTGKTTHILLWRAALGSKVRSINGDKPILRFIGGRLYACGTPWQGKENFGHNVMRPLAGLCFLEKGETNCIRRIDMGEAMGLIFHQTLMPREADRMERFLGLIEQMLRTIPCYRMQCNMEPEAAEMAYAEMTRTESC